MKLKICLTTTSKIYNANNKVNKIDSLYHRNFEYLLTCYKN